ncbi:hypothetical protein DAPK24_011330 [Pichia kluyveri]|uniref:IMS import disulfide relay-system CHCH-CHCH-like Cx9C domain-containing protein n=1 Tax=Pichia kluyveri TaxID=36015 RepID=A0AAV5R019_PICKL|nr:hypothetical protein DAPK24_011330 [Pichia kluyveri]
MSSLKKQPVKQATRLMAATANCSELSIAYGKCIASKYQNMSKDACLKEFISFKTCVQQQLARKV